MTVQPYRYTLTFAYGGFCQVKLKIIAGALALFACALASAAQGLPADSLTRGTWEFAPLIGAGSGLGKSSNTQFLYMGGRAGWVLTGQHLPGLLRGDFEWAGDALPVYLFFTPANGTVYGGSFKPVIWQWNFTSGKRIAPYVAAAGGIVFTTQNIPPGNTSWVNFTPQLVIGTRVFRQDHHAFFVEGSIAHLSSASLGAHNPGYNISLLFTVGYSWFKHHK
ncbi:MAG TPA: acyloxyacyl hydrolase [Candidatus Acidoferrum sp.]|nr:acyloxyacyl hydrolase [Candidatus Acidoferrum sp.]